MLLGYKVSRSHSKKERALRPLIPPDFSLTYSFPIPLQLRALAQGWKTQIRLKGADLAAGTEASPILHQSPQGKIQRDSDSGPGLNPARTGLRMEKSKNCTRTFIIRSFFFFFSVFKVKASTLTPEKWAQVEPSTCTSWEPNTASSSQPTRLQHSPWRASPRPRLGPLLQP